MHIFISGASGFIGSHFVKEFKDKYTFTLLSRQPEQLKKRFPFANVIGNLGVLSNMDDFDVVLNLAGEPIADKRWTNEQKERILNSRLDTTERLVQLINNSQEPPKTFLSGSAIGYYGRQENKVIDESFNGVYQEFSHDICQKWEDKAKSVSTSTRLCLLRTGIVLAEKYGALAKMLPPFKMGVGGKIAKGDQYMSWIHIKDMIRAIDFIIEHEDIKGVVNMTAPNPVSNSEFSHSLAQTLNRPSLFTTPEFVLRLVLGEMADLLVYGQNVVPKVLTEAGFKFVYPELKPALNEILRK